VFISCNEQLELELDVELELEELLELEDGFELDELLELELILELELELDELELVELELITGSLKLIAIYGLSDGVESSEPWKIALPKFIFPPSLGYRKTKPYKIPEATYSFIRLVTSNSYHVFDLEIVCTSLFVMS
jgi:hypothetical protein